MATAAAKGKAAPAGGKNGASESNGGAPAGFRRRSTVSDANWVATEKGNSVHGKLLGRHEMSTTPVRFYYQVELLKPCKVRVGSGEDVEIEDAAVGDVVNLNENKKLECLKEIEIPEILSGAEYEIFVEFGGKRNIGGGKTMWDINVSSKSIKGPTRPVVALPKGSSAEGEGSEAAPF